MPSTREVKSFFLMFCLKSSSEGCCRSLGDSLDQRYGPRYLIECFPYLTVEWRGASKSAILREYTLFLSFARTIEVVKCIKFVFVVFDSRTV